jgi:ATP-dependent Clp protease ATP-binding subunit ClpA
MCARVSQLILDAVKSQSDRSTACIPASQPLSRHPTSMKSSDPLSSTTARTPEPASTATGIPISRVCGDTSVVARKLTSNRFVGRSTELSELEQSATVASAEQPVLVLLGGDSGVGKTRLVAELERRLFGRDVVVLRGEAVEQDDGELRGADHRPATARSRA